MVHQHRIHQLRLLRSNLGSRVEEVEAVVAVVVVVVVHQISLDRQVVAAHVSIAVHKGTQLTLAHNRLMLSALTALAWPLWSEPVHCSQQLLRLIRPVQRPQRQNRRETEGWRARQPAARQLTKG